MKPLQNSTATGQNTQQRHAAPIVLLDQIERCSNDSWPLAVGWVSRRTCPSILSELNSFRRTYKVILRPQVRVVCSETVMNAKKKAVVDRIQHLEDAIAKGREYLFSGRHAHWHGFRALFGPKMRDGKTLPPHRDWVTNVFLPRQEKALERAYRVLEKLS